MFAVLIHLFSTEKRLAGPRPDTTINRLSRLRRFYGTLALLLVLGSTLSLKAADPYSAALDKRFEGGSTQAVPAPDPGVAALEEGIKAQAHEMSQRPELSPPPPAHAGAGSWASLAGLMTVGTAVGLVSLLILRRWNRWLDKQAAKREAALAEDPLMVDFLRTLHEQLPTAEPQARPAQPEFPAAAATTPDSELHTTAPAVSRTDPAMDSRTLTDALSSIIAFLRADFQRISRASGDTERMKILHEIFAQAEFVKERSNVPQLRSVRLLASGLHGLLNQLTNKASNITPSSLRTAAAAVDLLEHLVRRSSRPDLATAPPVRLLAVDDDAISRRAVSIALKKAFNDPDMAPDGRTALALAVNQPYDLIFLDIEMPGMDGFELCSKIRETEQNRTTPVVFVTSHTDFDSRAKSALLGAQDLIGKPFLAFEITVKALTVVLRAREEREAKEALGQTEVAHPVVAAIEPAPEPTHRNVAPPNSFQAPTQRLVTHPEQAQTA